MNDIDFTELDGFQFEKERRLSEWRERKEAREFRRLCKRLIARKWYSKMRGERGRCWRVYVANYLRQLDRRKRERHEAERSRVYTCRVCGTQWCRIPGSRGAKPEHCSPRCYHANYYHEKIKPTRVRSMGKYKCSRCGQKGHNRRRCQA